MDSSSNTKKPSSPPHRPQASPTQLLSSAKVVADAAKATLHHEASKVDKGKVADAAANLLGAASHYGKLEDKSFGKYVNKAETYLHQYYSSHSTTHSSSSAEGFMKKN